MAAEIKRLGDAELEIMQAVWGPEKRSILPTFRPHWPESAIGPRGRWAPPSTVCVKRAFWPVKSGAGIIFIPRWSVSPTTASGRGAPSWKSSMEIP